MIKFFRKIRQQLLTENKFSKYLLYAIGEIFLVVIGILIAFSLNNWNQNRQLMKEEVKVLKGLQNEMSENLIQFDEVYSNHIVKENGLKKILFTDLENYNLDEFDAIEKSIIDSWTYNPSFSIYNTLVNSGKIETISTDSLKYRIAKYKDRVNDYLEEEIIMKRNTRDHNWKYLVGQSAISVKSRFGLSERNEQERKTDKNHYLNEFQSPQFQNAIALLSINMSHIISDGAALREETLALIEILNLEIKKLDN